MMIDRLISFVDGWSDGYDHTDAKTQAESARQGKNYYLAAVHQSLQLASLGNIIGAVSGSFSLTCAAGSLVSLPAGLYLASLRQGDQKTFSLRKRQIIHFLAENTGSVIRVATVVAAAASFAMGSYFYSGIVLTSVIYEVIDKNGLVPRKVSLFIEDYMPQVPALNVFLTSPAWLKPAFILLLPAAHTPIYRAVQHKIDSIAHACFKLKGPLLSEIDKPLDEKKGLSFEEMDRILEGTDDEYEICPSHCSKAVCDLAPFQEDRDFNKYLVHFDSVNWRERYPLVSAKMKDDDRFMDFMKERFPKVSERVLKAGFDYYIGELSSAKDMNKEQYAAEWLRLQMVELVSVLKGDKRVVGSQQDLDIALDYLAKVLPHLSVPTSSVEREDILLDLAVEGGDYCSQSIKRIASELSGRVASNSHFDPSIDYELKIRQSLQDMRSKILQNFYDKSVKPIEFTHLTKDVQSFDLYREHVSLGFFPLPDSERGDFCMSELGIWEFFSGPRTHMYQIYRQGLDEAIRENGEVNLGIYIRQSIENNTALSREQKDRILEKYTGGRWSPEETNKRFHRLFFVMLNITKKKE